MSSLVIWKYAEKKFFFVDFNRIPKKYQYEVVVLTDFHAPIIWLSTVSFYREYVFLEFSMWRNGWNVLINEPLHGNWMQFMVNTASDRLLRKGLGFRSKGRLLYCVRTFGVHIWKNWDWNNGMHKLHKTVELMHYRDLNLLVIEVDAWILYIYHKRCIL